MTDTVLASSDDGLRERKRAATRAAIEKAALALALEHGYEHTTVEMICEAATVSQRTFFNYFGSKETVILGDRSPLPAEAEAEGFIHGEGADTLADLVEAIAAVVAGRELDPELLHARRQLIQRTPELARAEVGRMMEMQEQLTRIVLQRFEARGRADSPDLEEEARMLVALATGVMHFTMQAWRRSGFSRDPQELLAHSIELVKRISGASAPAA